MSAKVCILDYGSGNVRSVLNLISSITPDVEVSNSEAVIGRASHVVLPGVGSFGAAMEKIKSRIPMERLRREVVDGGKPFLGICVGLQVLAEKGYEFGEHEGLGWIPGTVEKLSVKELPVPHVGWNDVRFRAPDPLLKQFGDAPDFYFVHSFVFKPSDTGHVLGSTEYGETFCAVAKKDNIYGVQFHPEKSQKAGRLILENFLGLS